MTSLRPYLISAVYEWILDNQFTPYILVDASKNNVQVPLEYVQDGRIVLNITPQVINKFELGKEAISFQARFQGAIKNIYTPISAVLAIYAKENGQGMFFDENEEGEEAESDGGNQTIAPEPKSTSRPALRVIRPEKKDSK